MPKYHVEESILIKADREKVHGIVRDFKQWSPWSPWLSAEPDCALSFSDDGKSYSWDGKVIGSGRMTRTSETEDRLDFKLEFFKPFKSKADVSFGFTKRDESTLVSWTMDSALPLFMFFMVNTMKAWIGADYRRGLAQLKDYAETNAVPSKNEFCGVGEGISTSYVGVRSRCSTEEMGTDMTPKYQQLKKWADESAAKPCGPPMAIYHKFDIVKGVAEYTAALPVQTPPDTLPTGLHVGQIVAPTTYKIRHTGAYRHLGSGWSAGMMRKRGKTFTSSKGDPFEQYVNDPDSTPESELITEIHFPAR